jgi:hypothetical protein
MYIPHKQKPTPKFLQPEPYIYVSRAPRTLFLASTVAPASSSARTVSLCPFLSHMRGQGRVMPRWAGRTCIHAYTWMRACMCVREPIHAFACAHPSICTHCIYTHACIYTHSQIRAKLRGGKHNNTIMYDDDAF